MIPCFKLNLYIINQTIEKMFNILCIGDPHFKADNGETTEELTYKIGKLISERYDEIDAVAVLGDILHRHEKIDLHPFHRAMTFLEEIYDKLNPSHCKDNKYLYVLIGNHDRSNNRVFMTDEHVFNPLKKWKNTIVVDTAVVHRYNKNTNILLMPYVPPGRFREAYETVVSEKELNDSITLVLAHQEFHGAKMNTITSNEGDPWDSLKPLCISGHIHDYQELHSNMIYTGTPIQHGFADTGRKTISLFKIENSHKWKHERIDLKIKGKTTVKCHVKEFSIDLCPLDEYYVKVKANGTKREIKTFTESKKYNEALGKGIVFQFLELPSVEVGIDSKINESFTGINFQDRVREMVSGMTDDLKKSFKEIFE